MGTNAVVHPGTWWIYGNDKAPVEGVLTVDSDRGLMLELSAPHSPDAPQEAMTERILGQDDHLQWITLFACFPGNRKTMARTVRREMTPILGIHGVNLQSLHDSVIRSAAFKIDLLHIWLGENALIPIKEQKQAWAIPDRPSLQFDLQSGVRMEIHRSISYSMSAGEYSFSANPYVELHFDALQTTAAVLEEWIPLIARFFALIIGISVAAEEIEIGLEEDSAIPAPRRGGTVLRKASELRFKSRDIHRAQMFTSYESVGDGLGKILSNWIECSQRYEPVIDLFSGVVLHTRLHSKAQFLFLTQALEVFHARSNYFPSEACPKEEHQKRVKEILEAVPIQHQEWLRRAIQGTNYKKLDQRIGDLFSRFSSLAKELFESPNTLPERIRKTRNYLTHYGNEPKDGVMIEGEEMDRINLAMEGFLWACLLHEIGVGVDPIRRLIHRYKSAKFVGLPAKASRRLPPGF